MIKVLFGENGATSIKAAESVKVVGYADGPASVLVTGKETPPERIFAGWVERISEDVVCLGSMLDIGDIKEPIDSPYRKNLTYSMYAQNQYVKNPKIDQELKLTGEVYLNELLRLEECLENGETIRVWYSDASYSVYGFYSLCRILQECKNKIRIVRLPKYVIKRTSICSYRNWSGVSAEEFAGFLAYERVPTKEEVRMYALLWTELTEDNNPLGAVTNGKVTGVPEDFYGFLIWKRLTRKSVKEARLIGGILSCFQVDMGDWWLAKRIGHFVQQDKIRAINDSGNKYAKLICIADTISV